MSGRVHLLSVDVRGLRWALMLPVMQGWVRFALLVGGERTFPSRSQSSGSANPPLWYAQGRVAVPATLPHGVERGKSVRSGPSGSANPPFWYAGGRVAVPVILPLGGERTSPSRSQSSGSATCGIRETDAARTALAQGVACNHRGCATREPIVEIGRTQHPDSTCLHRDR